MPGVYISGRVFADLKEEPVDPLLEHDLTTEERVALIEKKLAAARAVVAELEAEQFDIFRKVQLICPHCNINSALKNWVFFQNHYRIPAIVGTERWDRTVTESCGVGCPACRVKISLTVLPQKAELLAIEKKVGDLTKLFTCVVDRYLSDSPQNL